MIVAALPSRWLARRIGDAERARHANILVTSFLLLGLLAMPGAAALPGYCLLRTLLGSNCPFCGVTRSMALALHGRLAVSWQVHPAGLLVVAILLVQLPLRAAVLGGRVALPYTRERRVARAVNAAVVLLCLARFAAAWTVP